MQGSELDALAEAAASAVQAAHAPGADSTVLAHSREAYSKLCVHPEAHKLAFRLADVHRPPQVQHLGFQVLLAALRARPPVLQAQARTETKGWLASLLAEDRWSPSAAGDAGKSPAFVRSKCAEAIAELAQTDWPGGWPDLKLALLIAGSAPVAGLAALALGTWSHIAEVVREESKELTVPRRRELTAALAAMVQQPQAAPELVGSLQRALNQHGADRQVVNEALGLCRALVHVVPVQVLLQHKLDKIVQVGLQIPELREMSVTAVAEWVDRVCPGKGNIPNPEAHDLARFTSMLVKLAYACRFDGNQQSYAFHRQVAELMADLCSSNGPGMVYLMHAAELGEVWKGLLHLLRYPSVSIQVDAFTGMVWLAKAQVGSSSGTQPARPPLEELVGAFFVHSLKLDSLPGGELDSERSGWLLRHLGPPSTAAPLQTFEAWMELLAQAQGFDIRSAEKDSEERSHLFGVIKTKITELVPVLCAPPVNCAVAKAAESYSALCRTTAELALRALVKGWVTEFDAAISLMTWSPLRVLKDVEKLPKEVLDAILQPSLAFLQQVTVSTPEFNSGLEFKRIEFLSHWFPFYKHFETGVVGQVLQRLLATIEQGAQEGGAVLQQRALDTLVSLGRSGALTEAQLEALNTEGGRLAHRLPPASRGKLIEALAAAVATCKTLSSQQQAQLIWKVMEQVTTSWREAELAQAASPAGLASLVTAAATEAPGAAAAEQTSKQKLKEARTLVHIFIGVVTRTMVASGGSADAGGGVHLLTQLVEAWAPGIFALAASLARVAGSVTGAGATVLAWPSAVEYCSITGSKELAEEQLPPGLEARRVQDVRNILWELRNAASKACRACLACPTFWQLPNAAAWMQALAEALPEQQPHVADMALKGVFSPAFGRGGFSTTGRNTVAAGAVSTLAPGQAEVCASMAPALLAGLSQLLRSCWSAPSSALEAPQALATVAVTRTVSLLLSELAGAGMPQAGLLTNPPMRKRAAAADTTAAPEPVGKRRRKNRNWNRYAALAEDDADGKDAKPTEDTSAPAEAPCGAVAALLRDRKLREGVRMALVDMLDLPEKDSVQRALVGLVIWSTQVWNLVCRGEEAAATGLGSSEGRLPEAGELLHAAGDALRILPGGVLKPVLRLITTPPDVPQAVKPVASRPPVACNAALASAVGQSWSSYISPTRMHGKAGPPGLVCDAVQVVFVVLAILTKLLRLQCRTVNVTCAMEQVYLCPSLFEALQLCHKLQNTSKAAVDSVIKLFIEEGTAQDDQRSALRVLLHKASPAFVPEVSEA